jgi:hypothetical protein
MRRNKSLGPLDMWTQNWDGIVLHAQWTLKLNYLYVTIQLLPQKTHTVLPLNKIDLLYNEIMATYCENRMEHKNTLCGHNAELLVLNVAVHIFTTRLQRVKTYLFYTFQNAYLPSQLSNSVAIYLRANWMKTSYHLIIKANKMQYFWTLFW